MGELGTENQNNRYFNSRPSARGDYVDGVFQSLPDYFNSRPSARGDKNQNNRRPGRPISIHAPPRGATDMLTEYSSLYQFQFTPLREGRRAMLNMSITGRLYFNSRPSARGDGALARRACAEPYFNSRPSARGDQDTVALDTKQLLFQFTPLREGRHATVSYVDDKTDFNSRPSARGDGVTITCERRYPIISIHAPPRGATAKDMQFLQIFCSTLTNQHGLTIVPRNLSRLFW